MASSLLFSEFDEALETWKSYFSRFRCHCLAHDVPETRTVPLLLSSLGRRMYKLLSGCAVPSIAENVPLKPVATHWKPQNPCDTCGEMHFSDKRKFRDAKCLHVESSDTSAKFTDLLMNQNLPNRTDAMQTVPSLLGLLSQTLLTSMSLKLLTSPVRMSQ